MTGTDLYPSPYQIIPSSEWGGWIPFLFVVIVGQIKLYVLQTNTLLYIYLIVPDRKMPRCLQCQRLDVGSFQSKCYMENK